MNLFQQTLFLKMNSFCSKCFFIIDVIMNWFKIFFAVYTLLILCFVNGVLLLCHDQRYCLVPVSSHSLRTHLAFKLRHFYQGTSMDMGKLFMIANITLGAEIVLVFYLMMDLLRKNKGFVLKVLMVTLTILFLVYSYSENKLYGNKQWVKMVQTWV